jgi:hypothetical protein
VSAYCRRGNRCGREPSAETGCVTRIGRADPADAEPTLVHISRRAVEHAVTDLEKQRFRVEIIQHGHPTVPVGLVIKPGHERF